MARRDTAGDVVLATMAGLSLGVVAGLVIGEWLGDVNQERVRRGLERLRRNPSTAPPIENPTLLEQVVTQALRTAPDVYSTSVTVEPIGPGTVELIGWTDDERQREHMATVAREVPGVTAVVNRVLVHGVDDAPPEAPTPDVLE